MSTKYRLKTVESIPEAHRGKKLTTENIVTRFVKSGSKYAEIIAPSTWQSRAGNLRGLIKRHGYEDKVKVVVRSMDDRHHVYLERLGDNRTDSANKRKE